jgi:GNAT superfamily N-acetyltransferase
VVPSFFSDEAAVELSGVYVKPSHRGRGAGSLLAREVARFARRLGLARVTLKTFAANEDALRFWRGLGFEPRMVQLTALAEEIATGEG